jgi:GTP-binding protein HflX
MISNLDAAKEKCIVIGLVTRDRNRWDVEDHLTELKSLALTAGTDVVSTLIQERITPDPAYFIGKGKAEEISIRVEVDQINFLLFDDELSPAQVRNLERLVDIKIIDRTALILDIFADHAKTSAAKTQVELAQLNYLLPRLTRQWQHLSRQVGGIGTKGPGETQLETDRRLVHNRISKLKERLKRIDQQGRTQRQNRKISFRASLVGYTNAGKSTIMNALSGSKVLVQDKLFATLDTTVRRIQLNQDHAILLGDTVGFIRKLPHHLIESFKTTLSEVVEADLLLHIVDLSNKNFEEHITVVNQILKDMAIARKPRLVVFNKVDLLERDGIIRHLQVKFPDAIFLSGKRKIGLNNLRNKIIDIIESCYEIQELKIGFSSGSAEHLIRPLATIIEKKSDDAFIYLKVKFPKENKSKLKAVLSGLQSSWLGGT